MNKISFGLAVLMAGVRAHKDLSFSSEADLLGGFKAWNCWTCKLVFSGTDRLMSTPAFEHFVQKVATKICEFKDFVEDGDVICPDITNQMRQPLFTALTKHILGGEHMCDEVFGLCKHPDIEEVNVKSVVERIMATKPASLANDDFVDNLYAKIAADTSERAVIKAVHITDVHIDNKYQVGAKANCDSFLCCRAESGPLGPDDVPAPEWGYPAGACDIPKKTFQSQLDYIVSEVKPDVVFWTGDNSSHNVWDNTQDEVIGYTETLTDMLKTAFKDTGITVLPVHGNHDTWPVD